MESIQVEVPLESIDQKPEAYTGPTYIATFRDELLWRRVALLNGSYDDSSSTLAYLHFVVPRKHPAVCCSQQYAAIKYA
jgi:hypothetical protein